MGRIGGGIMTVVSILVGGYFFFMSTGRTPGGGDGWELVVDLGTAKLVYLAPERCYDADLYAEILELLVGRAYRSSSVAGEVYFFDNKEVIPSLFELLESQTRYGRYPFPDRLLPHLRAKYEFMPLREDGFYIVRSVDSSISPPLCRMESKEVHPGFLGEPQGWLELTGVAPGFPDPEIIF